MTETLESADNRTRQEAIERAACALWIYENNPRNSIIDAILTDAYEALRRAKGE